MSETETTHTTRSTGNRTRKRRVEVNVAVPMVPQLPPKTEEEKASSDEILHMLRALHAQLRQRSLGNAVHLAIQASRGQGPLVDHFCELGRRFGHELQEPSPRKPRLRVIDGGAADLER